MTIVTVNKNSLRGYVFPKTVDPVLVWVPEGTGTEVFGIEQPVPCEISEDGTSTADLPPTVHTGGTVVFRLHALFDAGKSMWHHSITVPEEGPVDVRDLVELHESEIMQMDAAEAGEFALGFPKEEKS